MTDYPMQLSIYLVGYLDLMGQADQMSRLESFARTSEAELQIANAVGTQAATIRQIRDEFTDFSSRVAKAAPVNLEHLPPQSQDQYQRIASADVRVSGISDCFVIAARLSPGATFEGPEAWAHAARAIQLVLFGLAGMTLKALASKIPIRGGVEAGLAVNLTDHEVYGKALVDAVALEQRHADYPRILVGRELLNMLQWLASRDANQSVASGIAVSQARTSIERLISGTDDGFPVVHFLSDLLVEADKAMASEPGESLRDFRRDAEAWVNSEEKRFSDANNQKLRAKYHRLARYFSAYPWPIESKQV